MLACDSEERAAANFLPQIETSIVPNGVSPRLSHKTTQTRSRDEGRDEGRSPVLGYVGQVILDDRPDNGGRSRRVSVADQPLGVPNQGDGSKGRTIPLRPACLDVMEVVSNPELSLSDDEPHVGGYLPQAPVYWVRST